MKMIRTFLIGFALLALASPLPSLAQGVIVVATCGSLTPTQPVGSTQGIMTVDQNGQQCAVPVAAGSITAWAGGTLGAMTNYGTSPSAVLVPGVNAFITNALKLLDTGGTNQASIKAASTVAATTDTSLVVISSPNGGDPCQNPSVTKSSAAISISSATTTSLVAVSGSTTVYVCGFSVTINEVITTANTILFEYGVGAACTSPTVLTGTYGAGGITAGAPIVISAYPGHTIFKSAASAGICALTAVGASGSFQGSITYVQQ